MNLKSVFLAMVAVGTWTTFADDEWTELTRDDVPAEVLSRFGALIPYDAASYIHTGLVAHFDGIRNAGLDAAHDSSATTWKNLVSGGDATFVNGPGEWNEDGNGYYFNYYANNSSVKKAYALTDSITLGSNSTVQIAIDCNPTVNTADFTGLFRMMSPSADSYTFWAGTGASTNTLTLKSEAYTGASTPRPSFSG